MNMRKFGSHLLGVLSFTLRSMQIVLASTAVIVTLGLLSAIGMGLLGMCVNVWFMLRMTSRIVKEGYLRVLPFVWAGSALAMQVLLAIFGAGSLVLISTVIWLAVSIPVSMGAAWAIYRFQELRGKMETVFARASS